MQLLDSVANVSVSSALFTVCDYYISVQSAIKSISSCQFAKHLTVKHSSGLTINAYHNSNEILVLDNTSFLTQFNASSSLSANFDPIGFVSVRYQLLWPHMVIFLPFLFLVFFILIVVTSVVVIISILMIIIFASSYHHSLLSSLLNSGRKFISTRPFLFQSSCSHKLISRNIILLL